jgi:hypothetical protein
MKGRFIYPKPTKGGKNVGKEGKKVIETIRFETEQDGRVQLLILKLLVKCSFPQPDQLVSVYFFEWELFTRLHSNGSFVEEKPTEKMDQFLSMVGDSLFHKLVSRNGFIEPSVTELFLEYSQQDQETPANERIRCNRGRESVVFVLDSLAPCEDLALICARINHPRPISRS